MTQKMTKFTEVGKSQPNPFTGNLWQPGLSTTVPESPSQKEDAKECPFVPAYQPPANGELSVGIFGAGIAGLTAAHELAKRGFDVTVYESAADRRYDLSDRWNMPAGAVEARCWRRVAPGVPVQLGGLAASQYGLPDPDGKGNIRPFNGPVGPCLRPLVGEHGFRFFPAYYMHLWDLLQQIPVYDLDNHRTPFAISGSERSKALHALPRTHRTVYDNVIRTVTQGMTTPDGAPSIIVPRESPRSLAEYLSTLYALRNTGYEQSDIETFTGRVIRYMTTTPERRWDEYENLSGYEFLVGKRALGEIDDYHYEDNFLRQIRQMPRVLAAYDSFYGDARTIMTTWVQLNLLLDRRDAKGDGVMNGPTTESWFDHWYIYLERELGVTFKRAALSEFDFRYALPRGARDVVPHDEHSASIKQWWDSWDAMKDDGKLELEYLTTERKTEAAALSEFEVRAWATERIDTLRASIVEQDAKFTGMDEGDFATPDGTLREELEESMDKERQEQQELIELLDVKEVGALDALKKAREKVLADAAEEDRKVEVNESTVRNEHLGDRFGLRTTQGLGGLLAFVDELEVPDEVVRRAEPLLRASKIVTKKQFLLTEAYEAIASLTGAKRLSWLKRHFKKNQAVFDHFTRAKSDSTDDLQEYLGSLSPEGLVWALGEDKSAAVAEREAPEEKVPEHSPGHKYHDYYVLATSAHHAHLATQKIQSDSARSVQRLKNFVSRKPDEHDPRARVGSGYRDGIFDLKEIGVQEWDRFQTLSGLQFFFDVPLQLVRGHVYYNSAPWALSSICQQVHWEERPTVDKDGYATVMSVDIGDWNKRVRIKDLDSEWSAKDLLLGKPMRKTVADQLEVPEALVETMSKRLDRRGPVLNSLADLDDEEDKELLKQLEGDESRMERALLAAKFLQHRPNQVDGLTLLAREVWRQIADELDRHYVGTAIDVLPEPTWFMLDQHIDLDAEGGPRNNAPYLVPVVSDFKRRPSTYPFNPQGSTPTWVKSQPPLGEETDSWQAPHGGYEIHHGCLVLAGTWTKTFTRITSMEAACESGRHAVHAILDHLLELDHQADYRKQKEADHRARHPNGDVKVRQEEWDLYKPRQHDPLQWRSPYDWLDQTFSAPTRQPTPRGDYCFIMDPENREDAEYRPARHLDVGFYRNGQEHPWRVMGLDLLASQASYKAAYGGPYEMFPLMGTYAPVGLLTDTLRAQSELRSSDSRG